MRPRRCSVQDDEHDFPCGLPVADDADYWICEAHLTRLYAAMCARMGHALISGSAAQREASKRRRDQRESAAREAVVYYIQRGGLIKIGCTTNMASRMHDLMPDEILATEPGSYDVERQRHQQFADALAERREWFRPVPELLAHISRVRATHGPPAAAVVTWDGRRHTLVRPD